MEDIVIKLLKTLTMDNHLKENVSEHHIKFLKEYGSQKMNIFLNMKFNGNSFHLNECSWSYSKEGPDTCSCGFFLSHFIKLIENVI